MLIQTGHLSQRARHENAPLAIEYTIGGMAQQKALQSPRLFIHTWEFHESYFYFFPFWQRVYQ
jgi:hypothetical protein